MAIGPYIFAPPFVKTTLPSYTNWGHMLKALYPVNNSVSILDDILSAPTQRSSALPSKIDMSKYPHICDKCGGSCYKGMYSIEHMPGWVCTV